MDTNLSVLLVLSGALQAWGAGPNIATRGTEPHPTLSGVAGMIANAQGRERSDDITDLAGLQLRTRADLPGTLLTDYHTAGGGYWPGEQEYSAAQYLNTTGQASHSKRTVLSNRLYLTDACFLAVLTGPPAVIETAAAALDRPQRAIYLGRRACIPDRPPLLDVTSDDPDTVLATYPWLIPAWRQQDHLHGMNATRFAAFQLATCTPTTDSDPSGLPLRDKPRSFTSLDRAYLPRHVTYGTVPLTLNHLHPDVLPHLPHLTRTASDPSADYTPDTNDAEHDPFLVLT